MFSFDRKTAFVVGAGRNIGRAVALEFARRGARIAAVDIDGAGAMETARLIADQGGDARGVVCDVASDASVADAIGQAEDFLGDIDICANVAAILIHGNPEDIPLDEWRRIFECNFFGAVRVNAAVMGAMIARGEGYIVNTASVAGLYPFAASRIPYAASKAAVISMTQNLAAYLLPKGVRVSCLCPGPTITTISQNLKPWSEDAVMRGPGADYCVKTPEEDADILCDGMQAGGILIHTHAAPAEGILRRYAASPDDFIQEKIGEFARGESGMPKIDMADAKIAAAVALVQQTRNEK